jgi:hypothetical protein
VLQLLHLLIDGEMSLEEAFHQPRIDHSGGDQVVVDRRLQKEVLQKNRRKIFLYHRRKRGLPPLFRLSFSRLEKRQPTLRLDSHHTSLGGCSF